MGKMVCRKELEGAKMMISIMISPKSILKTLNQVLAVLSLENILEAQ